MSAYPATSLPSISFVAPGGNLLQPPASLLGAIITAVSYIFVSIFSNQAQKNHSKRTLKAITNSFLHVYLLTPNKVPATVLVDLVQPSLRASIASEFKAGNTPAWYATLPVPVKSYIEALASQIAGSSVNLSATPSKVVLSGPTTPAASGTAGAAGGTAKSTSSKAAAQTVGVDRSVGWMAGCAVGILGVAVAL